MPSLHVYADMEQRTEEWFKARCGIVTASIVGQLITIGTPDPQTVACPTCGAIAGTQCISTARKTPTPIKTIHSERAAVASDLLPVYAVADNDTSRGVTRALVAERLTGHVEETFVNGDMMRGIEHEPYARDKYAEHYAPVTEVGFMVADFGGFKLGYSPDGLVGEDGLIEIKCPRAKGHLGTILEDAVPAYYMAQCQAALLVSGRDWCDYISFCAGMPLYIKRVTPDQAWHDAIVAAVAAFETKATEMVDAYLRAVDGLPPTERIYEVEMSL